MAKNVEDEKRIRLILQEALKKIRKETEQELIKPGPAPKWFLITSAN